VRPSGQDDPRESTVEVPHEALSPETLRRLVEEFVTRDGTDYGRREKALQEKVTSVLRQLRRREVKIVFESASGTANIVPTSDVLG
jgi:uncharacterized protein YheU (UPF0270 family)